jgi:hypothetical protein
VKRDWDWLVYPLPDDLVAQVRIEIAMDRIQALPRLLREHQEAMRRLFEPWRRR